MSDLRELHYCLRVEFKRNREVLTIIMNQRSYINEVLKCFNMKRCKLVRIMFDTNSKLLKLSDEEFGNVQKKKVKDVPYKAGVSSLMYAILSMRDNFVFAVSTIS